MLASITSEALSQFLAQNPFNYHPISEARLSTTEVLIDHFENSIGPSQTLKDFYRAFIVSRHQSGLIKLVPSADEDTFNNYLTSAIAGGKNLVTQNPSLFDEEQQKTLATNGIRILSIATPSYPGVNPGHLPFERHTLPEGKSKSPIKIIGHIFKNAKNATFYDRYVNQDACSLISALANEMAEDAKITVIRSTDSNLSADQIREKISPNTTQRLQIETATEETRRFFHDRYIYVDDHYEIHLPRGLDCFGRSPSWRNRNSVIEIHDCSDSKTVEFSCQPRPGRDLGIKIPVRSTLVAK